MNNLARDDKTGGGESKWGYAFAGGLALAFATVIQFAFGGLDDEMLENLPAIVTIPYGIAGKLGITVPLALLGLGLIARDVLANAGTGTVKSSTAPARRGRVTPKGESELEFGEPIPDEVIAPAAPIPASKKIPAGPARPAAASAPATPTAPGGGMVLTSAKYLTGGTGGTGGTTNNGTGGVRGGGNFRKGRTQHTNDSDE
jgi:hypothetical protein